MICLSRNLKDRYINSFARGGSLPIYDYDYNWQDKTDPIVVRGLGKASIIKNCLLQNRDFYYMDSGYFGNYSGPTNPRGWKLWHRVVKNDLQHNTVIDRPDDRLKQQLIRVHPYRHHHNKHILLVTPSEKPCKFYNIDVKKWKNDVIKEIKKYTDRPIKIREKGSRINRLRNSIYHDLQDTYALVTYQSIAAIESVLYGIPAYTLAPTAADPVCEKDLSTIEQPKEYAYDLVYKWASHIAYGQFHIEEMKNGTAYNILKEEEYEKEC